MIKITAKTAKSAIPQVNSWLKYLLSYVLMQARKCVWKLKTQRRIISFI